MFCIGSLDWITDIFLGIYFSMWSYGNPAIAAEPQGPYVPLYFLFSPLWATIILYWQLSPPRTLEKHWHVSVVMTTLQDASPKSTCSSYLSNRNPIFIWGLQIITATLFLVCWEDSIGGHSNCLWLSKVYSRQKKGIRGMAI